MIAFVLWVFLIHSATVSLHCVGGGHLKTNASRTASRAKERRQGLGGNLEGQYDELFLSPAFCMDRVGEKNELE